MPRLIPVGRSRRPEGHPWPPRAARTRPRQHEDAGGDEDGLWPIRPKSISGIIVPPPLRSRRPLRRHRPSPPGARPARRLRSDRWPPPRRSSPFARGTEVCRQRPSPSRRPHALDPGGHRRLHRGHEGLAEAHPEDHRHQGREHRGARGRDVLEVVVLLHHLPVEDPLDHPQVDRRG